MKRHHCQTTQWDEIIAKGASFYFHEILFEPARLLLIFHEYNMKLSQFLDHVLF